MSDSTTACVHAQVIAFTFPELFFIVRVNGRSKPATFEEVAHRFGGDFARAVSLAAGEWIEFDNDPRAEQPLPPLNPIRATVRQIDPTVWPRPAA
jgi:hypothetical protein